MNQLLKLLEFLEHWPECQTFCVTTMEELAKKLELFGKTYVTGECNQLHPARLSLPFLEP